jgi:hypothetical protein
MTLRSHAAVAVVGLACLLWSCDSAENAAQDGKRVAAAQSLASLSADEVALIDRVTTLETMIPDAAQRQLYAKNETVTENGQRSHTFVLKPQAGMDAARHFQIITVTWARPGTFSRAGASTAAVSGTGGPGGSFVEKTVQTPDRVYEVRVTLGELLPSRVQTGAIDLDVFIERVVDEYNDANTFQR